MTALSLTINIQSNTIGSITTLGAKMIWNFIIGACVDRIEPWSSVYIDMLPLSIASALLAAYEPTEVT